MTPSAIAARGLPAALGLFALYALAVGTAAGRRLDAEAFDWLTTERFEPAAEAITGMLNRFTFALAATALVVVAYRRSPRCAWIVTGMLVACSVTAWLMENGLGSLDPLGGEHRRALGPAYFPSGHATAATSLAFAAVLVVQGRRRKAVAVAAACFITVFGVAVVVGGSHTPSDVLGALLLCAAWTAVAATAARGSRRAPERPTPRAP
jgi:membrane-associated phospholipid phosphatase